MAALSQPHFREPRQRDSRKAGTPTDTHGKATGGQEEPEHTPRTSALPLPAASLEKHAQRRGGRAGGASARAGEAGQAGELPPAGRAGAGRGGADRGGAARAGEACGAPGKQGWTRRPGRELGLAGVKGQPGKQPSAAAAFRWQAPGLVT